MSRPDDGTRPSHRRQTTRKRGRPPAPLCRGSETDDPVLRVLLSAPQRAAGRVIAQTSIWCASRSRAGACVARCRRGCAWRSRRPASSPAFDRIYGCSAGALNGAFAAAGQACLGATIYEETASRRFINAQQLARGRPIVDLELVFEEASQPQAAIVRRRPRDRPGIPRDGGVAASWRAASAL